MIDAGLLAVLVLSAVLAHIERRAHADERARLTKAALSVNPAQAAQALEAAPKQPDPAPERRPTPIGL